MIHPAVSPAHLSTHPPAIYHKDALEVRAKQLSATLESERKLVSGECRQLRDRITAAEDKATDQILEFEQASETVTSDEKREN